MGMWDWIEEQYPTSGSRPGTSGFPLLSASDAALLRFAQDAAANARMEDDDPSVGHAVRAAADEPSEAQAARNAAALTLARAARHPYGRRLFASMVAPDGQPNIEEVRQVDRPRQPSAPLQMPQTRVADPGPYIATRPDEVLGTIGTSLIRHYADYLDPWARDEQGRRVVDTPAAYTPNKAMKLPEIEKPWWMPIVGGADAASNFIAPGIGAGSKVAMAAASIGGGRGGRIGRLAMDEASRMAPARSSVMPTSHSIAATGAERLRRSFQMARFSHATGIRPRALHGRAAKTPQRNIV